ncbi:uncharacterized protein LOC116415140 [Apis florea]|uniref:uncharacterized protein LOC116415140 n=1 Tax=Apis florea TaxID=7463 RepID=UPI0012FE8D32|nr:uncharacterized protein LOC116415140 [Apis florea]
MGTSAAIHRITESGEILSRITPEECCWFATQSRCGVSRISDNVVENDVENSSGQFKIIPFTETPYVKYYEFNNCTAYLDCSHHARDKEWYCQSNTMNTHPSKVHRQRENYESFMSERGDGSYIIIGTPSNGNRSNNGRAGDDDFDNDTRKQTVKMESNDSPKHTSFSSGKKDGNV